MCNGTEHPHVLGLVWSFVGTIPSNPRGQTLRETEAEFQQLAQRHTDKRGAELALKPKQDGSNPTA